MTLEQKNACQTIIHSHAAVAAVGNVIPVPGLGFAADLTTMTTMAMALSSVFGGDIEKNVAKNIAIASLKRQVMKHPIKVVTKEVAKFVPWAGSALSASVSVVMLESAGWAMAKELEYKFC